MQFDHDRLSEDDFLGGAKVDLVPYIEARPGVSGMELDEDDEEQQLDVTVDLYKLVGRVWLTMKFAEYAAVVGPTEPTAVELQAEADALEVRNAIID